MREPIEWEFIITGCGTSHGTPIWGYPDLWSEDPRDHRRRSGAMLKGPNGEVVLIDAGPDLLYQLRDPYKRQHGYSYPADCITRCDAVLLTHDHADHSHGINELRHLNRMMDAKIPLYAHISHLDSMRQMFAYCFENADVFYQKGSPAIEACELIDGVCTDVVGLPVTSFYMSHGSAGRSSGFRIGSMAYLTDLKYLPLESDVYLQDIDLLVLDMLREELHSTHLAWSESLAIIERLQPQRCILTHMGQEVRYAEWESRMPAGVSLAVDGMTCKVRL